MSVTDIKTVEGRETIVINERPISLVYLTDILGLCNEAETLDSRFIPILIIGSSNRSLAVVVDNIVNEQEVVVKELGKLLQRVRNTSGATVLGSGKVVPILNVADLLKSATNISALARNSVRERRANAAAHRKSVLVAEDSITSRTLLRHILEAANYEVETAVDGADAFEKLKKNPSIYWSRTSKCLK